MCWKWVIEMNLSVFPSWIWSVARMWRGRSVRQAVDQCPASLTWIRVRSRWAQAPLGKLTVPVGSRVYTVVALVHNPALHHRPLPPSMVVPQPSEPLGGWNHLTPHWWWESESKTTDISRYPVLCLFLFLICVGAWIWCEVLSKPTVCVCDTVNSSEFYIMCLRCFCNSRRERCWCWVSSKHFVDGGFTHEEWRLAPALALLLSRLTIVVLVLPYWNCTLRVFLLCYFTSVGK